MLIPSIDLMGGKIVQLVQGERKALEFDDFSEWIERFRKFPMVQVIDLDAAMSTGSNRKLVEELCSELSCQVGGGLRSVEAARLPLSWGAKRVIIGSSLFSGRGVNVAFALDLAEQLQAKHLIFAVDSRGGYVAIKGWRQSTGLRPADVMRELEPFCSAFLYTHIDSEGLLQGFPSAVLEDLLAATKKKLIVAGGITSSEEVQRLDNLGIDAVVGMAIYTGEMQT
ncbi:MAG TPA: HisA/HisF-related TIM barrel protein [Terriglobales bacterium]|nr:HisA/HisF-related TIM barrel protein [Terriglobales bacterium]